MEDVNGDQSQDVGELTRNKPTASKAKAALLTSTDVLFLKPKHI